MGTERKHRRRAMYWESPEVQAWIELAAADARDLELFDRAMRRRSAKFRRRHLSPDDADGRPRVANSRRVVAGGRAFDLAGFLNYSHEEAARSLGLRSESKPGNWEGPKATFDLLLGEQRVWTGAPADGPCGVCRGADLGGYVGPERVVKVVCLWCGRSNLDRELGPVSRKPDDPKPKPNKGEVPGRDLKALKGGRS